MELRGFILSVGLLLIAVKVSTGLQCFYCNSSADENCATLKLNTTDAECDGNCAIWVTGTTTFRGCESEIPEDAQDDATACDRDGCNKIIFPDDRIKCVKCSSNDDFCTTPDASLLYPCKNYEENDSCYTYVIDESSTIRGCLSDQDANVNLCNSVGENCIKCSEEFCNLQGGKSYVECFTCSSVIDGEACGFTQDPTSTSKKLCEEFLGRDNLCFAYNNQTHSIRGCLNDYEDLKSKCGENSDECQICNEDSCNSMKVVEEFCYSCDSSTDAECKSVATFVTPTLCGEGTIDKSGCYLYDKDNVIRRGCVTALTNDQLEECRGGVNCKICRGSMCNVKPAFQKCFVCSSEDNPSCATLQETLPEKICDDLLDTCKVYVIPNSTTHRGCFNEMIGDGIECSPQSVNCRQCSDNNCNGEIFPSNRLSCFHCEGANSSDICFNNLVGNSGLSQTCEVYNFRDSCYFYIDDNKVVHRGCLSDSVNATEACDEDPVKCRKCQTSDCNSESIMKTPEISCITCDTTNGEDCNWGWATTSADKCKKERFFYEEESCYILTFSDQTIRGCTLDGNVCRVSPRCELCKNEACNRVNTAQHVCLDCSSDDDPACGPDPQKVESVVCPGIVQYEYRGCYTWIDDDKTIMRGCYSDLAAEERTSCTADEENCVRCLEGENCNNQPKDSAGSIVFSFSLMLSMLLLGVAIV